MSKPSLNHVSVIKQWCISQPKVLVGAKYLNLREQLHLVWHTASQSIKRLDMQKRFFGGMVSDSLNYPGYGYVIKCSLVILENATGTQR